LQKTLDANSYATKKTIAQGMLDIALLTANASQLKYVLQVGQQHEFYTLMVWLISISIVLQVCLCSLYPAVSHGSSYWHSPVGTNMAHPTGSVQLALTWLILLEQSSWR
jgi:hypothetical protein